MQLYFPSRTYPAIPKELFLIAPFFHFIPLCITYVSMYLLYISLCSYSTWENIHIINQGPEKGQTLKCYTIKNFLFFPKSFFFASMKTFITTALFFAGT